MLEKIKNDLYLFFSLFTVLTGILVGVFAYDLKHPFINEAAKQLFNFLLN